jgi:predicted aspartyl protease
METATVGRIVVPARIENNYDLQNLASGVFTDEQVRRIEVEDARVDTGATYLSMPKRMIDQLGLQRLRTARAQTAAGPISFGIYGPARLTVQGRDCIIEVSELADDCPVLIGVIPLELLDFVVDPKGQQLIGNPDHGGEWMFDMYHQAVDGENQSASPLRC